MHAGLAAQSGLRAALLAAKGFTSRTDAIECAQGFAAVHGADFRVGDALERPAGGFHLLANLFKFHAACYSTHSTIEAVHALRQENSLRPEDVAHIRVVAGEGCSICNIQSPTTALEAKFSLRACAAFALLGIDTSGLVTWDRATDAQVIAVRDRVQVNLVPGMTLSDSVVTLRVADGREFERAFDCGVPPADKAEQSQRIAAKFMALASPVVGDERATRLLAWCDACETQQDTGSLMSLAPDRQ